MAKSCLKQQKASKTHRNLSQKLQNRLKSHEGACQIRFKWCGRCFKPAGRDVVAVLLKARLSRSLFRLDFPKTHFSHSHSFWRRVFQISFSESAPLRFTYLKARLSDSAFWPRAFQIRFLNARLSDSNSFEIAWPVRNLFAITFEITFEIAFEIDILIH